VVFEAVHRDQDATIFWHLDGNFLSGTRDIHQMEVYPGPGRHTLVLIDEHGEELVRHFTVPGRNSEEP
jgi:penicillin-binding protein 1C